MLQRGLQEGHIVLRRGQSEAELISGLCKIFGYAIQFIRDDKPITLTELSIHTRLSISTLRNLLGKIEDWNWLIDGLRFTASDRGHLDLSQSVLLLKSAPTTRSGSSIFGVASRGMPEKVFEKLRKAGLSPPQKPSPHSLAIDCSVWLVEIGPEWQFAMRIEPLLERTWFDLSRYSEEQRPLAQRVLTDVHGFYSTSTRKIVKEEVLGSFFASAIELQGGAEGAVVESGCLQHGLGVEEVFVGARLEEIRTVERAGAWSFLDLARMPVRDPDTRRRMPRDPWSGTVRMGEEDCTFEIAEGEPARSREDMAWAAQMELGCVSRRADLEGIFRPVSERVLQRVCQDPSGIRYVVAKAWVGKGDAPRAQRQEVGLLVRDYRGELGSGWSVPFGNLMHPDFQAQAIGMAESHLLRVAPEGEFMETVRYLRGIGVQSGLTRARHQIQILHGLAMSADILDTRSRLYV